jgi:hypothetical protein
MAPIYERTPYRSIPGNYSPKKSIDWRCARAVSAGRRDRKVLRPMKSGYFRTYTKQQQHSTDDDTRYFSFA